MRDRRTSYNNNFIFQRRFPFAGRIFYLYYSRAPGFGCRFSCFFLQKGCIFMFINSTIFLACNDIFMDFYNYIELSDLDKAHCSKYETLFLWKAYCYIIFNHFTIMNFMVSTIFPHFNICTPFCLTQVGIVFLLAGKQMLHLIDRQNLLKCYLNLLSNSGRHMFIISNCASRKC